MLTVKNPGPPETIYLQCYDEYTGNLLDFVRDEVTWCRDQINNSDAVYILVTPELAELLDGLATLAESTEVQVPALLRAPMLRIIERARALATRIKDSLA